MRTFMVELPDLIKVGSAPKVQREFDKVFSNGAEYQTALDWCASKGHLSTGIRLLELIGPTDEARTYDSPLENGAQDILFAGSLECTRGVVARNLIAGGSIYSRAHIWAGKKIQAGTEVCADGSIQAIGDICAGGGVDAGTLVQAEGYIRAGKWIQAGQEIAAGGEIHSGEGIESGGWIFAGDEINAGKWIQAGYGIDAGGEICAGADYGIYAGHRVPRSKWPTMAVVTAARKPENLMSGFWKERTR